MQVLREEWIMDVCTMGRYAGYKKGATTNGNQFVDFLVFPVNLDGEPDIEQIKVRSYNPQAMAQVSVLHIGDMILLRLNCKDVLLSAITKVEDEE